MRFIEGELKLIRIYVGEEDTAHGMPLFKYIVNLCRENGVAGATVLRGMYGYGASSVIKSARTLALSADLPIIIEVVDTEAMIDAVLPAIEDAMEGGLITVEKITALKYAGKEKDA